MKHEKYAPLLASTSSLEFKFNSIGPKGNISIIVQFKETDNPKIYTLAFGNLSDNGDIDDHVRNGNRDRNKILATVAAAVYEFTSSHPGKLVMFTGSTPERTRLYRMALTNNLDELVADFHVYGINHTHSRFSIEDFEKNKDYFGFVVKRKID